MRSFYTVLCLILITLATACSEREQVFVTNNVSPTEQEQEQEVATPFQITYPFVASEELNNNKTFYTLYQFDIIANEDLILDAFVFYFINVDLPDARIYVNFEIGNTSFGSVFDRPDGFNKVRSQIFNSLLLNKGERMACTVMLEVNGVSSSSYAKITLEELVGYRRLDSDKTPFGELNEKSMGANFFGPNP